MNKKELKKYLEAVENDVIYKNKLLESGYIQHIFVKVDSETPSNLYEDIISILKTKIKVGQTPEFDDSSFSTNISLLKEKNFNTTYVLDIMCDEMGMFKNALVYDIVPFNIVPFSTDKYEFHDSLKFKENVLKNELGLVGYIKITDKLKEFFFVEFPHLQKQMLGLYLRNYMKIVRFDFNRYLKQVRNL